MNQQRAVTSFCRNSKRFPRLPFITDEELSVLFGPEVARSLLEFNGLNQERRICFTCGGECCEQMRCEIFAPEFEGCPIHEYRPFLCRFHFCPQFAPEMQAQARALRDICLESASRLETAHPAYPALELNLLLYRSCQRPEDKLPEPLLELRRIMVAAETRSLSWEEARARLREKVETYRERAEDDILI